MATAKDIAGYSDSEANEVMADIPSSESIFQLLLEVGPNEIFNQAKEQLHSPIVALLKEYKEKTPDEEFYNRYHEMASNEAAGDDFKTKKKELCNLMEQQSEESLQANP